MKPIPRSFYSRHPADVAPDLLGKLLVRRLGDTLLAGKIVEVEAYSWDDPASHTFRGKTERNKAMFGEPGHAYIYFIHGLHYCVNVSSRLEAPAGGVLIRALEPVAGIEVMQERRKRTELRDLASGPAKLTQAMGIDKALYGVDMTKKGPLYIAEPKEQESLAIRVTPRIGISRAMDVPWRFVVAGSRFLSK